MASNGTIVSVVGLEKLLKKLDVKTLVAPAQTLLFREEAAAGKAYLAGQLAEQFPATSHSVTAESTPAMGKIAAPRLPYVFFERGSQYPHAAGTKRSHRRRTGVATSALRIKPRRFLSKTRSKIRRDLKAAVEKMKAEIEKAWVA